MRANVAAWAAVSAVMVMIGSLAAAQGPQHRATHLGNPATRFAPPLTRPEDLRARFRDPKLRPDIAEILQQWGWKGDVADLHRAAATAPITEYQIQPGTRLPFMSSRRNGRPVTLKDVLWDGAEPAPAYVFHFSSRGRRYRCVTPKACSNFLLIDLGPEVPRLEVELSVPGTSSVCHPMKGSFLVRNAGHTSLTGVRAVGRLPAGLRSRGASSLQFDLGGLRPGEVRVVEFPLEAAAPGEYACSVIVNSAEGLEDEAVARIRVRGPVLAVECSAPGEVPIGRPSEICLSVRNTGDAPEPVAHAVLSLPAGATVTRVSDGGSVSGGEVVWDLEELAPGASRNLCVSFTATQPGVHALEATLSGSCAPTVRTRCEVRRVGVPGILLEVVDLEDPIEVGGEVTYEIRATNQGFARLTNVRAVAKLPEIQDFVRGSGATEVTAVGSEIRFGIVPVLEGKETVVWRVITRARAAGDRKSVV